MVEVRHVMDGCSMWCCGSTRGQSEELYFIRTDGRLDVLCCACSSALILFVHTRYYVHTCMVLMVGIPGGADMPVVVWGMRLGVKPVSEAVVSHQDTIASGVLDLE